MDCQEGFWLSPSQRTSVMIQVPLFSLIETPRDRFDSVLSVPLGVLLCKLSRDSRGHGVWIYGYGSSSTCICIALASSNDLL